MFGLRERVMVVTNIGVGSGLVKVMVQMFQGAKAFNGDISKWDVFEVSA